MRRSGQIACGIVLGLISLISLVSTAQASDGIQSMTAAVCQGEVFLELEVISVKRSQVHRTYHNGIKRLMRNEYEVVCSVVENATPQGPKAGSEITLFLSDPMIPPLRDFDGKERTDIPRPIPLWPSTFWGEDARKGVKFFAAFRASTDFKKPVYPLASRRIEERAAWDAAVVQHKQTQLFLNALSKTMPKFWKPSNKAVRVTCRATRENVGRKMPFKSTDKPKEDARQRELREGIEYTITSPVGDDYTVIPVRKFAGVVIQTSVPPPGVTLKTKPYTSSFRFVVFKKPYMQLPHQDPPPSTSPPGVTPPYWYRLELPQAVVYLDKNMKNTEVGMVLPSQMSGLFLAIQKAANLCNPPKEIKTAEIVKLLETADIDMVATSHRQAISIVLKDGTTYTGVYVHKQAGKYAKIKKCFDILNLVKYIQKERNKKEKIAWGIMCE